MVVSVVPLLTQIWMYASPVVYSADAVPDRYRVAYYANPMASVIDGYRRVLLLGQTPQLEFFALGALIALLMLFLAYSFFKHVEPQFADVI